MPASASDEKRRPIRAVRCGTDNRQATTGDVRVRNDRSAGETFPRVG
jgi:hypothetical protein